MPLTRKEIVYTNLKHAKENGYFDPGEQFYNVDTGLVVDDMLMYCEDVDGWQYDDLYPLVNEWMKENGLLRMGS